MCIVRVVGNVSVCGVNKVELREKKESCLEAFYGKLVLFSIPGFDGWCAAWG